jgi:hypothetical protein
LETFVEFRPFVENPLYEEQREASLSKLDINTIDAPLIEIINDFARLPYCFTLQSCYGHFLYDNQKDSRNVEPLSRSDSVSRVEYKIAYMALCIQNSDRGKLLLELLREIPSIDPDYVQFGCAQWFWKRQINSYVLQVEPKRYQTQDTILVGFQEALRIEKTRNEVFDQLKKIVKKKAIEEQDPGIRLGV